MGSEFFRKGGKALDIGSCTVAAQEDHPIGDAPVEFVDTGLTHIIESIEQTALHAGEKRCLGGYELDQAEGKKADDE